MKKRILAIIICIVMCLMAVPAVLADSKTPITSLAITGMQTPIIGQKCSVATVHISSVPADATEFTAYWLDVADGKLTENDVFKKGHTYILSAWVAPKDGYMFQFDSNNHYTGKATINGKATEEAKGLGDVGWIQLWSSERFEPIKGTPITSISINCTQTPVIGQKCTVDDIKITTVPANVIEYTPYWYDNTDEKKVTDDRYNYVFIEDHTYSLNVWAAPKDGYMFQFDSNNVYTGKATINGKAPKGAKGLGDVGWIQLWSGEKVKPVKYAPKTYTLTTSVSGGHGTVTAGRSGIAANTEETVIFLPDEGYEIDKVTVNGALTGVLSNVLNVKMDGNKTLVVTYKKIGSSAPTQTPTQKPTQTPGQPPEEKDTFRVSFRTSGHGAPIPEQTVKKGAKAVCPADPAEEGLTFDGWYADSGFTAKFDFQSAITKDTVIYAKWIKPDGSVEMPTEDPADPTAGEVPGEPAPAGSADAPGDGTAAEAPGEKGADPAASDEAASHGISLWVILLIILLLCLAAGGTVFVILKKKKKKDASESREENRE